MGKKTELRVWLSGEEMELMQEFCDRIGARTWTAAVRFWLASTKTPQARDKHGSRAIPDEFIQ